MFICEVLNALFLPKSSRLDMPHAADLAQEANNPILVNPPKLPNQKQSKVPHYVHHQRSNLEPYQVDWLKSHQDINS